MIKKIIIFILFPIILLLILFLFDVSNDQVYKNKELSQEENTVIDEITEEPIQTTSEVPDEYDGNDIINKVDDTLQINGHNNKDNNKDNNKNNINIEEKNKTDNTKKVDNNSSDTKKDQEPVVEKHKEVKEEIKKINPWDELGISEYDYYNKPMWSWARIDFDVNNYGSQSATEKACQDKGWELYEQGYGFKCTNVVSYSGKYLGEYLKTF